MRDTQGHEAMQVERLCGFRSASYGMIGVAAITRVYRHAPFDLGLYRVRVRGGFTCYVRTSELARVLFPGSAA